MRVAVVFGERVQNLIAVLRLPHVAYALIELLELLVVSLACIAFGFQTGRCEVVAMNRLHHVWQPERLGTQSIYHWSG